LPFTSRNTDSGVADEKKCDENFEGTLRLATYGEVADLGDAPGKKLGAGPERILSDSAFKLMKMAEEKKEAHVRKSRVKKDQGTGAYVGPGPGSKLAEDQCGLKIIGGKERSWTTRRTNLLEALPSSPGDRKYLAFAKQAERTLQAGCKAFQQRPSPKPYKARAPEGTW